MFDGKVFGQQIVEAVRSRLEPMADRIKAIEEKVARLETELSEKSPVKYLGVYKPNAVYSQGSLITFDGSIWHANKMTREAPGDGCQDWQLALKRGRDGKDAR